VSHASAWEVAIKTSLGKLKLQIPYEDVFPAAVLANGFAVLTPRFDHYRALIGLPWHHRDPFDRLLVAQAQTESLTLVSKDPHFWTYGISILW
jgi:PIN domain nuclease of toxin-antitoxin system